MKFLTWEQWRPDDIQQNSHLPRALAAKKPEVLRLENISKFPKLSWSVSHTLSTLRDSSLIIQARGTLLMCSAAPSPLICPGFSSRKAGHNMQSASSKDILLGARVQSKGHLPLRKQPGKISWQQRTTDSVAVVLDNSKFYLNLLFLN